MPRFVLLYHDCPPEFGTPSHWDFMLERDGVLMTWRLEELPAAWVSSGSTGASPSRLKSWPATRLADHRLAYQEYEGSLGGDRGTVRRIDAGEYWTLEATTDSLGCDLVGDQIRGRVTLRRIAVDDWLLELESTSGSHVDDAVG